MKSPLLAYKSDMRGNYANPKYVKEELVGVKIGEALTKAGTDIFSGLTTKPKSENGDGGGSGGDVINNIHVNGSNGGSGSNVHKGSDTDITTTTKNILGSNQGNTGNSYAKSYSGLSKDEGGNAKATGDFKGGNLTDWTNYVKDYNSKKNSTTETTRNEIKTTWTMNDKGEKILDGPVTMKGSPVKHNAGAVGSIGNADPSAGELAARQNNPFAQMLKSNNVQQKLNAAKSQQSGSGIFGTIAQAASQGGSVVGSIGQQIGNQAQQRAADAGGSTGVDPFLPPPNQVAETGSYGGNGDRMLEMDSNPVGNQSIGRNTNLASQLFGSGQRASMLAMKGTPLHHDSEKQAHTHPTKTTTKMKPDGEYPGARYVKGDLVDQDDLLDKTKLDAHIATQVQSDKKGTFIKEKSDDGPGSDIETSKGFGKKIRLESMGRSSYTSNMKDQLDPHNYLFQNTPKK